VYDGIKKNIEILALIEPGVEFNVINRQNGKKVIHTNLNNVIILKNDIYTYIFLFDFIYK